jgi:hypothetical protein
VIVNSSKGLRQLGQQVVEGWFPDKGNPALLLHMRKKKLIGRRWNSREKNTAALEILMRQ